jgi:hypothetical protein
MSQICFFCKRAPSESQCEICKRLVCIQCSGSGNHNCYPREGLSPEALRFEPGSQKK